MSFYDQIIVIYTGPDDFDDAFVKAADAITMSRYWHPYVGGYNKVQIVDSHNSNGIEQIHRIVEDWATHTHENPTEAVLYVGFQGPWNGWDLENFHDILDTVAALPDKYPPLRVSWLPDNWFDHPGLVPTLTSGENALEWLEQQVINDETKIEYNFRGGAYDGPPAF